MWFSVCLIYIRNIVSIEVFANQFIAYLNLRGEDPKAHAVWRELTRLRQYFDKIKTAETGPEQRTMTLDKEAANRFIKHGLVCIPGISDWHWYWPHQAGNDRIDLERKEREAKERAVARRKELELLMKSVKSEQSSKNPSGDSRSDANSDPDEDEDGDSDNEEMTAQKPVDAPRSEKTEKTGKKNKDKNKRFKQGKKLDREGLRKENTERKQKKKKNRKERDGKWKRRIE